MRIPEKVFSEEEMGAYFEEVLKQIAENNIPLTHGIFENCPDGGESGWFTNQRTEEHFRHCALCRERRQIHLQRMRKLMS